MSTTIQPVRIVRILRLGAHNLELLEDGSIDIVDADIERSAEYAHLDSEEAYFLLVALNSQLK